MQPNTVIIGIDTSAGKLLVTAEKNGRCVTRRRSGIQQERLLLPVVQKALQGVGGTLEEVNRVCLVRGPGRFTGIRIALTFASMLQQINGARVYGITLFELVQRQVVASAYWGRWKKQHPQGALGVVLHAFRDEYFLQIFDEKNTQPRWLSREELLQTVAAYPGPILLAGSDKNGENLTGLFQDKYPLAAEADCRVRPEFLRALASEETFAAHALEPLYLKPARFEQVIPA